jgi:hypothetical protein
VEKEIWVISHPAMQSLFVVLSSTSSLQLARTSAFCVTKNSMIPDAAPKFGLVDVSEYFRSGPPLLSTV